MPNERQNEHLEKIGADFKADRKPVGAMNESYEAGKSGNYRLVEKYEPDKDIFVDEEYNPKEGDYKGEGYETRS